MSTAVDMPPFDVCGPLPTGVTVLEASAGTGKTFTIAGLAARYVADGIPLEQLLLVTFTRMATAELRDRVRERLVSAEHGLERALAGVEPNPRDDVLALLAGGTREEVETRRRHLAEALADFDAATIVTTHGFCQEVLGGLGIIGDLEPGVTFVEDLSDLVDEVVDDLYVRRFQHTEDVTFDRAQARDIAREAVNNPAAPIEPPVDGGGVPAMRARLAAAVRDELEARKRRNGVMTYDDLLMRLERALHGDEGDAIAARLRDRYRVVLVDEFQDTDPTQWNIMRRAFADGGTTLVLIGDPKQAIYAFRGADVYAYLAAAEAAGARRTLDVNWRSDQGLIDAYDGVFGRARLGHEGIVYRRVRAAAANQAPRLSGAPRPAPLRVRVVDRAAPAIGLTNGGYAATDGAREHIAVDLAADVVELLAGGAQIDVRAEAGETVARQPVEPGHLAVLVRRNRDAELVRDALDAAGVPAVLNGAGSVFAVQAATDWLRLLEALERPSSEPRAHAAALTAFLGWSTERVACASDDEHEDVHRRLHHWAHVLRTNGVAALMETITLTEGLPARLLGATDGERRLTDLRHVAQLLHAVVMDEQLGTAALTVWLRKRIARAAEEGDEERSRRLESDAAAVQVLTIHRSKGLEFPIVYLPFLWHPTWVTDKPAPVTYHDPDDADRRKVDVGLAGPAYNAHKARYVSEQRGEDLRLAYVGLTRARHQAVVWWAGTRDSRNSPLGRLVFGRDDEGNVVEAGGATPSDADALARFGELAASAPGCISVEPARPGPPATWSGPARPRVALGTAAFDRELDLRWRRTSYSAITAGAYEARVASEPEVDVVDDEETADAGAPGGAPDGAEHDALRAIASPLAAMPAGVHVGTYVHRVLEAADFAAPDLAAELAAQTAQLHARRNVDIGDPVTTAAGLHAAIETPLGPLLGDARLRDVSRSDRLDELGFELPLVGGDRPTGELTLAAIGALLREHVAPGDPLAGYADRLADPELRTDVRGYLTGSIDLVARREVDGAPRFVVVDYKTNRLAGPDEPLTLWHFRPAALAAEMQHAHYALQGLLYSVALHRYLRWRLTGYAPETHLGGFAYLFVRGMAGAETPRVDGTPCGVFAWRPPAGLVEALSDVLDRGAGA